MIRPSKAVIAGAAVAGLLTGSFAMRAYAASTTSTKAGVAVQTMADAAKHGCKGQNECKGQGGCKTGDNGCKAKRVQEQELLQGQRRVRHQIVESWRHIS